MQPHPWIARVTWAFYKFAIYAMGGPRVFSWVYGYDDEVKAWASQNRTLVTIFLTLTFIVYAMWHWMDEDDRARTEVR